MTRRLAVSGARLAAALVLGAAVAPPCVARAQPPVWIAKGAHARILIFGSVHLLPAGLDWRPPALTAALSTAKALTFELPIDEHTDREAARLVKARGLFPKNDGLLAHLSPDQIERLFRATRMVGASAPALERMRPWLAELTLSLLQDAQAGALAARGVEQEVQALAPTGARRLALETPARQIDVLAGASLQDQIAALDVTLKEIVEKPNSYCKIVDEWLTSDLAGLQTDALEPLRRASPALYRRLITDRNRRWVRQIRRQLAGAGEGVVIVGVGHLLGPGGVPDLLRAAGVDVTGPIPPPPTSGAPVSAGTIDRD